MLPSPESDGFSEDQKGFHAFLHDLTDVELIRTLSSCQFVAQYGLPDDRWMLPACNLELRRRGMEPPEQITETDSFGSGIVPSTEPR